jgi:hypothetical protein
LEKPDLIASLGNVNPMMRKRITTMVFERMPEGFAAAISGNAKPSATVTAIPRINQFFIRKDFK